VANAWRRDPARTTFLLDVRTADEFRAGHAPACAHAEGGQLLQATDQYVGVRGARLVLVDDTELRAILVASFLAEMGWEVAVLKHGRAAWDGLDAPAPIAAPPLLRRLDPAALRGGALPLLDARPSMRFRAGHIAGARWVTRARLGATGELARCALVADDEGVAALLGADLAERGTAVEGVLLGTPDSWRAAGLEVVATPDDPPDAACIDYLFFVHDRHDGNLDAARRYIDWEIGLVNQIDAAERAGFRLRA
jgi:rhodanese-related sulfurtransferase